MQYMLFKADQLPIYQLPCCKLKKQQQQQQWNSSGFHSTENYIIQLNFIDSVNITYSLLNDLDHPHPFKDP